MDSLRMTSLKNSGMQASAHEHSTVGTDTVPPNEIHSSSKQNALRSLNEYPSHNDAARNSHSPINVYNIELKEDAFNNPPIIARNDSKTAIDAMNRHQEHPGS